MNVREALARGIHAAQIGDRWTAYRFLQYVTQAGSAQEQEQAWMWLGTIYDDQESVRVCLQAVLALNPANKWAQQRWIAVGLAGAGQTELSPSRRLGAALLSTGDYRHPRESLTEWITLLFIFITVGVVVILRPQTLVFLAVVLVIGWIVAQRNQTRLLQLAMPVTKSAHPELLQLIQGCTHLVRVPPTRFFILNSNALNAMAVGVRPPFGVVLNSALIDALDSEELRFIVGHELGHIHCGHMRSALLLHRISRGLGLLGTPLWLVTLWWDRCTEYTADRAGLLVCGSLEKAQSALLRISLGAREVPRDTRGQEELIRQVFWRRCQQGELGYLLHQLPKTHPFLSERLLELRVFNQVLQRGPITRRRPGVETYGG